MIEPVRIELPAGTIEDLHARLKATRWPIGVTDSGGVPVNDMREVVRYWLEQFDWHARANAINSLPHFQTTCGGLRFHFIHARSSRVRAIPLLLLHGWPGSFVEMLPIIPMLSETFHVVVPSLPGYGFSEAPAAPGMSNARIATLCAELMTQLGYQRFVAQGGDWGAGIATWLARQHPNRVMGIHLNYIPGSYKPFVKNVPSAAETTFLRECAQWVEQAGAYGHLQRTRPLTLAYALSDSPVGVAAWIIEKFREWADPDSAIPLDAILTNVTIYWATNTIASSMRLYLESARTPLRFAGGERMGVRTGIARFPFEAPFPPRSWVERAYDVVHWIWMPRGGHFAALEGPDLLAKDLKQFVAILPGGNLF